MLAMLPTLGVFCRILLDTGRSVVYATCGLAKLADRTGERGMAMPQVAAMIHRTRCVFGNVRQRVQPPSSPSERRNPR